MRILSLSIMLLSFGVFANPTPVLDCQYKNANIKASVQVMNSSSPQDKFDKFQTYYYYKDTNKSILISKLVRYEEMFNDLSDREIYLFKSSHESFSFKINKYSMRGTIEGSTQIQGLELDCESYVDLDKLKNYSVKVSL